MGQPWDFIHPPAVFQHIAVHAAAPIAKPKGNQQIFIYLFLAVLPPHSLNCRGKQFPIVGIEPGAWLVPGFRRGDKMCQYFTPINAFPPKCVVRHTVILVPTNFGSHKRVDPSLFQNLRQCPGIPKYIREPQIFHLFAKFIFNKFAAN